MCQASQLSAQTQALAVAPDRQDFFLTLHGWVFKAQIETPSSQRVTQTSLFIRTQHDKRHGGGFNGPQFGHRDLPGTQNLQQQGFNGVVDLVEFVDQKHARPNFIAQRAQQWSFRKEIQSVEAVAKVTPRWLETAGLRFQEELLQGFVEFPDDLLLGDSHVTLQPLDDCVSRRCYRISQLGLATSWRTFYQQWFPHARCQIHHLQRDRIDDV